MSDGVRFSSAGPLSLFAIVLLIALLIIIIPLFILGVIGAAFTRLGFSWISALAIVLLMLFGSFVNIPVYRIRRDMIRVSQSETTVFDECVPCASGQVWDTTISINFGGAVIPVCVCLYLMYQAHLITGTSLFFPVCAGITMVAIITFVSTRLVPYAGIQVPLLIPGPNKTDREEDREFYTGPFKPITRRASQPADADHRTSAGRTTSGHPDSDPPGLRRSG